MQPIETFNIIKIFTSSLKQINSIKRTCIIPPLIFIIPYSLYLLGSLLMDLGQYATNHPELFIAFPNLNTVSAGLGSVIAAFALLICLLILPLGIAGAPWVGLMQLRNEKISVSTGFQPFKKYFKILALGISIFITTWVLSLIIGFIFNIFGIHAGQLIFHLIDFMFFIITMPFFILGSLLITDKNLSAFDSFATVWKMLIHAFSKLLLFSLFSLMISIASVISLVGWIWLIPALAISWAKLYQSLFQDSNNKPNRAFVKRPLN